MALKRCENGHYFDPLRHSSCPSCGVADLNLGKTRPVREAQPPAPPPAASADPPRAVASAFSKTVPLERRTMGVDPVVGWLVCIEGPDRGQDYRIRSERNFIGRGDAMDIRVERDETISREKHASVSFNPKNQQFKLHPGEGRGLVYLNGDDVAEATPMKDGDVIELGQTKLLFVPLCGPDFAWS
jgi:hypothetical protein